MSSIAYLVPDILVRRNGSLEYRIYDMCHLCACVFLHIHVAEKAESEQYVSCVCVCVFLKRCSYSCFSIFVFYKFVFLY